MSVEQAQRAVNQIDKEIADLEKKMADLVKKEADKTKKIGDINRSITKNTSQSTLSSKMRQAENYQKELSKIISDKASVNQKLADKRKRRIDAVGKLQKEELAQAKKTEKQQKSMQEVYERQIRELTEKIQKAETDTKSKKIYSIQKQRWNMMFSSRMQ